MKKGWKIMLIIFSIMIVILITMFIMVHFKRAYHCGRGDCFFKSTDIPCNSNEDCYSTGLYCYVDEKGDNSYDNESTPVCNLDTNTCEDICGYDIIERKCNRLGGDYYPVTSCD